MPRTHSPLACNYNTRPTSLSLPAAASRTTPAPNAPYDPGSNVLGAQKAAVASEGAADARHYGGGIVK